MAFQWVWIRRCRTTHATITYDVGKGGFVLRGVFHERHVGARLGYDRVPLSTNDELLVEIDPLPVHRHADDR